MTETDWIVVSLVSWSAAILAMIIGWGRKRPTVALVGYIMTAVGWVIAFAAGWLWA